MYAVGSNTFIPLKPVGCYWKLVNVPIGNDLNFKLSNDALNFSHLTIPKNNTETPRKIKEPRYFLEKDLIPGVSILYTES